jgi:hypothetical protein
MGGIHFGLGIMLGWYVTKYGLDNGWSLSERLICVSVMVVGYCQIGHGLAYVAAYLLL